MHFSRLAVLGSGTGSNFRAILAAIDSGPLRAEVVGVASDVAAAGILSLAESRQIQTYLIEEPKYKTRLSPEVESTLVDWLKGLEPDLIVLAGYLRVVKEPMLEAFPRKILNVHPSLLPKYPGLAAWKQALDAKEKMTGCSVHYVDCGVDTGEVIARSEVPILHSDTPESLHARIQAAEHRLYPEVIQHVLESGK